MNQLKRTITLSLALLLLVSTGFAQKPKEVQKLDDNHRMAWWRDARFGMFIHWGAYSVPGGERNGEVCRGGAEWIMDKLDYTIEDYERKVVGKFNPVNFDAEKWVKMAKDAGMKYIVFTTKHHDGFCMWDSKVSDYNIVKRTPFGRDVLKELAEACRKEGIKLCLYHSIVDWHHPQAQAPLYPNYNAGQKDQSVVNPEFRQYFENYLKPQVKELLTNYGDIGVMWFDGDWIADYTSEMGKELYNFIRDIQPNIIINNRVDKGRMGMAGMDRKGNFAGDFGTPEQEVPDTGIDSDWESCMTMNRSWGYKPSDKNWKSSEELIHHLVDIVSKGGNFLLNIGPDPLGEFPPESVQRLADMGRWMKVNSEAVYGAKASPFSRPEWGRYTSKRGLLYAHIFDWPENGKIQIDKNLKVTKAVLLADPEHSLTVEESNRGDFVLLPKTAPDTIATVVRLEVIPSEDWPNLKRYSKANTELPAPAPGEKRVVFMGNSITEGWVKYDPGFFEKNGFIGRGISGQTTAQMLLRFRPDVINLQPQAVVLLAGTNDIAANRGSQTLEQIFGNIVSMSELAKANNIQMILCSVLPASSYGWRPAIYPADKIIELNKMIEAYARENNLIYVDYYSAMVNDQKGLKEELGRDSVHPNVEGYKIMEKLVVEDLDKALN